MLLGTLDILCSASETGLSVGEFDATHPNRLPNPVFVLAGVRGLNDDSVFVELLLLSMLWFGRPGACCVTT